MAKGDVIPLNFGDIVDNPLRVEEQADVELHTTPNFDFGVLLSSALDPVLVITVLIFVFLCRRWRDCLLYAPFLGFFYALMTVAVGNANGIITSESVFIGKLVWFIFFSMLFYVGKLKLRFKSQPEVNKIALLEEFIWSLNANEKARFLILLASYFLIYQRSYCAAYVEQDDVSKMFECFSKVSNIFKTPSEVPERVRKMSAKRILTEWFQVTSHINNLKQSSDSNPLYLMYLEEKKARIPDFVLLLWAESLSAETESEKDSLKKLWALLEGAIPLLGEELTAFRQENNLSAVTSMGTQLPGSENYYQGSHYDQILSAAQNIVPSL